MSGSGSKQERQCVTVRCRIAAGRMLTSADYQSAGWVHRVHLWTVDTVFVCAPPMTTPEKLRSPPCPEKCV